MEVNITRFFYEAGHIDYSASAAEIGDNAASDTWQAALDDAADWHLLELEWQRENFAGYAVSTGGWQLVEIEAFTNQELQALCIQFVAGWIREAFPNGTEGLTKNDWREYCDRLHEGEVSGVFDMHKNGEVFCYFGI